MTISPSTTQPSGSAREQRVVQLGEVAVERPQVAALDVDLVAAAEDDGAEAVPLRLVEQAVARRAVASASLASIGSIGGAIGYVGHHQRLAAKG